MGLVEDFEVVIVPRVVYYRPSGIQFCQPSDFVDCAMLDRLDLKAHEVYGLVRGVWPIRLSPDSVVERIAQAVGLVLSPG